MVELFKKKSSVSGTESGSGRNKWMMGKGNRTAVIEKIKPSQMNEVRPKSKSEPTISPSKNRFNLSGVKARPMMENTDQGNKWKGLQGAKGGQPKGFFRGTKPATKGGKKSASKSGPRPSSKKTFIPNRKQSKRVSTA